MTPTQLWADLVALLQALPEWQALLVVVVGSVLVAFVVRVGGDAVIRRFTRRVDGEIDDIVLGELHPPLYVSAVLLGAYLARDALTLDERLAFGIEATVLSLLTVVWAFALTRVGRKVSVELTADTDRDQSVVPIFQNVWSAAILGVSAYLLLRFWRVDVTPLLASAGIAGIVIGFAARDTIANFFGSIALYSDGTYRVGDYIVLESGQRGRVEDISIRSTVVRTRDDVLVTIPNSVLNSAVIVNESAPKAKYRIRCSVGVAYGSDLDHVEAVMLDAAERTDVVLENPRPRVRFREFGDSALQLELLAWVRHPVQRGRGTHQLNKAVYEGFGEAGVEVPFPQRDVTLRATGAERVDPVDPVDAADSADPATGA